MRRLLPFLVVPLGAIGIVTGIELLRPSLSLTPVIDTPYAEASAQIPRYSSLEELRQIRDRLQEARSSTALIASTSGVVTIPTAELQKLQAIEIRVQIEETALRDWQQAVRYANQATELTASISDAEEFSVATLEEIHALWSNATGLLASIPDGTLVSEQAQAKRSEYESYLQMAAYRYDTARSDFLKEIAERTGLPTRNVFITVCHQAGECRRWQGNEPPASAASLIKLPIAVALMEKVTSENISLNTKILVSRSNYTEDASDIWVGAEYTLEKLLMRMINNSSNIATNQFIDYIGRDYMNQVLRDRGFKTTFVDYKMVGEATFPANAGSYPNLMTTDEMTEMMRQIYAKEHEGDEALITALATQEDTVLGHDGLKNTKAIWLGEKTGQNSEMLGTTYAFSIDGENYFATIALNYSGNEAALRRCVKDIALHITENNGF